MRLETVFSCLYVIGGIFEYFCCVDCMFMFRCVKHNFNMCLEAKKPFINSLLTTN